MNKTNDYRQNAKGSSRSGGDGDFTVLIRKPSLKRFTIRNLNHYPFPDA